MRTKEQLCLKPASRWHSLSGEGQAWQKFPGRHRCSLRSLERPLQRTKRSNNRVQIISNII